MNLRSLALLAMTLLATTLVAAGPEDDASAERRLTAAEILALPLIAPRAGTSGVPGIRQSIVYGDPTIAGPYTVVLQVPPHTRIAAHRHRDNRSAVVVAGTWYFGYGEQASDGAGKALGPGGFYTEPADRAHFARTEDAAVTLYISGYGPTDTRYVEAANAPPRP